MKRLTPSMKRRLLPYIPTLLRRFKAIAAGLDETPCPLCVDAGKAQDRCPESTGEELCWHDGMDCCFHCPVFAAVARREKRDYVCDDYMPHGACEDGDAAARVVKYLTRLDDAATGGRRDRTGGLR